MPTLYDKNGKPCFKAHMINAKDCVQRGELFWENPKKRKPITKKVEPEVEEKIEEAPMPLGDITEEFLSSMNKIPMVEFVEKRLEVDLDRAKPKKEILAEALELIEGAKK